MTKLTIIGLGLIGGSLGLALKRAGLDDLEVTGFDREPDVEKRALKLGAIDRAGDRTMADAVQGAALVVIAAPILQVHKVLEEIAPALREGAVVTDTASTKAEVCRWADEALPEHISFVGGHPIAGKEIPGIDASDSALFEGRPWAITPSLRASEDAISVVENLVCLTGAHPVTIDAQEHDSYLGAVSHLPLIASIALFSLVSGSRAWPELATLAGPGFRDITRLASSSPDLSHDISLTNRENLVHWIERFVEELRHLRELIASEGRQEELIELFAKAQTARDAFIQAAPEKPGAEIEADTISAGERMISFLVGEYVLRRTKEIEQAMKEREER